MTRLKVVFADIEVEIESNEQSTELIDKMAGILGYLIPERLKFNAASIPCDEDSGGIPPQTATNPILPSEVLRSYM